MELTIHALSHSYGDKKALTGFTHTFVPGITALLGPNGCLLYTSPSPRDA